MEWHAFISIAIELVKHPRATTEMLSKPDILSRYIQKIFYRFLGGRKQRLLKTMFYKSIGKSDTSRWQLQTNLHTNWENRTATMAQWIPENSSIMEFGCGRMLLKKYLPQNCRYFPSDLVSRSPETFLIDLNQNSPLCLPKHDVFFFSGVLEYVHDLERLLQSSAESCRSIILSYAPCANRKTDSILERRAEGWVNDYSREDIINLLNKHSFVLLDQEEWNGQWLFFLELTTLNN